MRISTSQIYSSSLSQMNSALSDYMALSEMNSSQKRINTLSDDPSGAAKVMELRAQDDCLQGYIDNCATALDLLGTADETLTQVSEMITSALETAEQASTETYTETQMESMAIEIYQAMESIYSLTNTKLGENALFAGNDIEADAYEEAVGVTWDDDALSDADIVSITGTAEDTIWVQFDTTGSIGTDSLDYRYSTDGGDTWTTGTLGMGDTTITCGDCTIEFATGTVPTVADGEGEGAGFFLRQTYTYTGGSRAMELTVAENSDMEVTLVGSDIFGGVDATGAAYGESDYNLFEILADMAVAMEQGDSDAVAETLEDLQNCQEELLASTSAVGADEVRATYAQTAQTRMQEQVANTISNTEDADASQLLIELSQAEYIYEAVLQSTADIMSMSILNYL